MRIAMTALCLMLAAPAAAHTDSETCAGLRLAAETNLTSGLSAASQISALRSAMGALDDPAFDIVTATVEAALSAIEADLAAMMRATREAGQSASC